MSTRREFVTQVAAGVAAATFGVAGCGSSPRIKSVVCRDETILRLGGVGDNYHMSWAADDRQFVAVCDGTGWLDPPKAMYNSRLFTVSGDPEHVKFEDVVGYPDLSPPSSENIPRYYGFGTLALNGGIYQFLSTYNHAVDRPGLRYVGAKLIHSPDNGRTWRNQDGSTPVLWEAWENRSHESMIFFEEDQDAFSLLSILQMGRNYEQNKDGFVYVYAPNGSAEGTMNQLVMFRVSKTNVLDRGAYEYFAGLNSDGSAMWRKEIRARAPVHVFPSGWVNSTVHPFAWMPSVTYNAPLGVYMMASWGMGSSPQGEWFGKPSYLGMWTAKNPWGPWTQIHEELAWTPANDPRARAFAPQIAPKWIGPDGRSFWLVWSDYQLHPETELPRELAGAENLARWTQAMRKRRPYYSFNAQRFDVVVA